MRVVSDLLGSLSFERTRKFPVIYPGLGVLPEVGGFVRYSLGHGTGSGGFIIQSLVRPSMPTTEQATLPE